MLYFMYLVILGRYLGENSINSQFLKSWVIFFVTVSISRPYIYFVDFLVILLDLKLVFSSIFRAFGASSIQEGFLFKSDLY